MKTYKINRNLVIIEKPKLDCKASGWIIYRKPYTIIQVKRNLPDKEKALVIIHELTHYIQYKMDDNNTQRVREKIAKRMEEWFRSILDKYPPFLMGVLDLIEKKENNG